MAFINQIKAELEMARRQRLLASEGMVPAAPGFGTGAIRTAQAVAAFDALPLGERMVRVAHSQLGVHEDPRTPNAGVQVDAFIEATGLRPPEPWCACFATWVAIHALYQGPWPAARGYVPSWEAFAKAHGLWVAPATTRRGDLLVYCWNGTSVGEHIGLCTGASGSERQAIEGNTSADEAGSQTNGGCVAAKTRALSLVLGGVRLR